RAGWRTGTKPPTRSDSGWRSGTPMMLMRSPYLGRLRVRVGPGRKCRFEPQSRLRRPGPIRCSGRALKADAAVSHRHVGSLVIRLRVSSTVELVGLGRLGVFGLQVRGCRAELLEHADDEARRWSWRGRGVMASAARR